MRRAGLRNRNRSTKSPWRVVTSHKKTVAIDGLTRGLTLKATAARAQVSVSTLQRWIKTDPVVAAASERNKMRRQQQSPSQHLPAGADLGYVLGLSQPPNPIEADTLKRERFGPEDIVRRPGCMGIGNCVVWNPPCEKCYDENYYDGRLYRGLQGFVDFEPGDIVYAEARNEHDIPESDMESWSVSHSLAKDFTGQGSRTMLIVTGAAEADLDDGVHIAERRPLEGASWTVDRVVQVSENLRRVYGHWETV